MTFPSELLVTHASVGGTSGQASCRRGFAFQMSREGLLSTPREQISGRQQPLFVLVGVVNGLKFTRLKCFYRRP